MDYIGWLQVIAAAVSIGLSILLMPIFNSEHPPAAGTALGMASIGWKWDMVLFVVVFAVILSIVRSVLLSRLKDLV